MKKYELFIKVAMIFFIIIILNYMMKGDIRSYARVAFDELRNDGEIDILFLGPSHTEVSVNVNLIEKETGLNLFNAGTAVQQTQGSYYILRETSERNGLKKVFLDVSYNTQTSNEPLKDSTYNIIDYLVNYKYQYAYRAFGIEGIINACLPFLHNSEKMAIKDLKERFTREYLNNSYTYLQWEDQAYAGQGFFYYKNKIGETLDVRNVQTIKIDYLMSEFSEEYLYEIIRYCKSNNIELILMETPLPDATVVQSGNYQAYIDYISKIASINELEYLNFNLIKREYLSLSKDDYLEHEHLNYSGAVKFSNLLSKILNGESIDNMFYQSFEEKEQNNQDGTMNLKIIN